MKEIEESNAAGQYRTLRRFDRGGDEDGDGDLDSDFFLLNFLDFDFFLRFAEISSSDSLELLRFAISIDFSLFFFDSRFFSRDFRFSLAG